MKLPEGLLYTRDHEWVLITQKLAKIGITDYAQDALGDLVYVGLPEIGTVIQAGESFAEVESTKSVSDIYAPVGGTVVEVNLLLKEQPEKLNSDPYGDGWICVIEISGDSGSSQLMDSTTYQALIADS